MVHPAQPGPLAFEMPLHLKQRERASWSEPRKDSGALPGQIYEPNWVELNWDQLPGLSKDEFRKLLALRWVVVTDGKH